MNTDKTELNALSERVIGAVFEVSNTLGPGFLEKVYQRALLRELSLRGISAQSEVSFAVSYKGYRVGEYFADIVVEGVLVVELKCVERLASEHLAQSLNYLRASGLTLGLLVNFQKSKVEWKRVVLDSQSSEREDPTRNPKKSGLGLLAPYGPGPSAEEIDENRVEMFRGFGDDPVE